MRNILNSGLITKVLGYDENVRQPFKRMFRVSSKEVKCTYVQSKKVCLKQSITIITSFILKP